MSPSHVQAAISQAAPDAPERMKALVLKGLDKDVRDKIQQADDQLALTQAVRTLEANQEAMADYIRNFYDACVIQDKRVEHTHQQTQALETKVDQYNQNVQRIQEQLGGADSVSAEHAEKDQKLRDGLAVQEKILTDRMEEIKQLFIRCDEYFRRFEEAASTEQRCEALVKKLEDITTPSAAVGPADSEVSGIPQVVLSALHEAKKANGLLKTKCDDLQRDINKVRESVYNCEAGQVAMQVDAQELALRVESVAAWGHQQDILMDQHGAERSNQLYAQIVQLSAAVQQAVDGACKCPMNCPGKGTCNAKTESAKEPMRVPLITKQGASVKDTDKAEDSEYTYTDEEPDGEKKDDATEEPPRKKPKRSRFPKRTRPEGH